MSSITLNAEQFKKKFNISSSNYVDDSLKAYLSDENYGISIGNNNHFSAGVVLFGGTGYRENTIIGSNNYIGPNTIIKNDTYIGNFNNIEGNSYLGNLSSILNYITIDANSNILDQVTIGSFSQIGCLTPVFKDVTPFSKIFGNPPKIRLFTFPKKVKEKFTVEQLEEIKNFVSTKKPLNDTYLQSIFDEFYNQSRKKSY